MPLKIVRGHHWEIIGRGTVLITCPPSTVKNEELYTGPIVEETALLSKSHALIEGEPKQPQDVLTAERISSDFQTSMKELLEEFQIKLILSIVGTAEPGIELIVSQNDSDDRFTGLFKEKLGAFNLRIHKVRIPEKTATCEVGSIQIGLGPDERGFKREQIISSIVDLIGQINILLGPSEGDERASSILH